MSKTQISLRPDAGAAILEYLTSVQHLIFQRDSSAWDKLTAHVLAKPMRRIHTKLLIRQDFKIKLNEAEVLALSIVLAKYPYWGNDAYARNSILMLQMELPAISQSSLTGL
ncbi:MAG: hypothetical protein AAGG75_25530 [Bacteroidota bacterium]